MKLKEINQILTDWEERAEEFEDEDNVAPTKVAIKRAKEVAFHLSIDEFPLPSEILILGDGGIAFQWGYRILINDDL